MYMVKYMYMTSTRSEGQKRTNWDKKTKGKGRKDQIFTPNAKPYVCFKKLLFEHNMSSYFKNDQLLMTSMSIKSITSLISLTTIRKHFLAVFFLLHSNNNSCMGNLTQSDLLYKLCRNCWENCWEKARN